MFTTSIILRPLLGLQQESSTGQDSRFCFHAVTAAFASGQPGPPLQLLRRTSSQRLSPCRSEGGCHIGREASAQSASCGFKEARNTYARQPISYNSYRLRRRLTVKIPPRLRWLGIRLHFTVGPQEASSHLQVEEEPPLVMEIEHVLDGVTVAFEAVCRHEVHESCSRAEVARWSEFVQTLHCKAFLGADYNFWAILYLEVAPPILTLNCFHFQKVVDVVASISCRTICQRD